MAILQRWSKNNITESESIQIKPNITGSTPDNDNEKECSDSSSIRVFK